MECQPINKDIGQHMRLYPVILELTFANDIFRLINASILIPNPKSSLL